MILKYAVYKDFANEDGTYDDDVVPSVENYNQLVRKHNQKEYNKLIEKFQLDDKNIHFPHLIEELKNYKPKEINLTEKCKQIIKDLPNSVVEKKENPLIADRIKHQKIDWTWRPGCEPKYFIGHDPYTEDSFRKGIIKSDFYFVDFSKNPIETIKQVTPDIQHVITPSKNYFLFKLSNDGFKGTN